ncbi:hypothetical protein E6P09_04555 [Haloferax mediterranei ATCC 33500]|uniref:Uncharacterized protein n=1 Tax=Haloferax mediterranei (strain ATCC 33500 / DSM 1411 / JCM 8866 / NBRC 14739 / NCIMB 2177 / R-4) TaxID=523841 RepID=I3R1C2_HALMT|nr:hypothetical protein [Haloferax mediterranei]AFK18032.2 hypothetical protein HFX_0293 [Haloferax mediterranei ATCC 33500]AHZ22554.1 hypothetical protein BM92_07785 [Haloferax mediterranei ATCC 33500]EMA02692.1 hypothetical protein C439_08915 [Haloferax mediterranei ATCC 33500]MDX5988124.1 hypothetical protein [Haloferax mediterranei ATCC 33500]QCQ76584.1 hypothetical protein E6P09_04555 [Haloferax mediterranei ATCC 33500]
MKALPLVIAILLVASPALGAVGPDAVSDQQSVFDTASPAQAQAQQVPNETIRVLDIPESNLVQATVESQHVDLGPSLDLAALRAGGQIQTGTSIERIESASDDSIRQQLIIDELSRIEQRAIALQSTQRTVIERFNQDQITARELLVELARIDAEARSLNERRVELRTLASNTPDFSIDSGRLAGLERELDTFTGPVRKHAVAVMTGGAEPTRFSVRTSETGVVLSVVADGKYIREAYRSDLRDRDQSTVMYEEALGIVADNYPTVYSSRSAQNGTNVISAGNSHRVRINYNGGQLSAYVDAGSGEVFKESQARPLRTVTSGTPKTEVKDGLSLTAYQTYPGGPLRIQLNETETDDPVDANVTIGLEASQESTLLGHTGTDGTIWTVSPSGPFTITVIKGNSAVVLTSSPTPIPGLETNTTDQSNSTPDEQLTATPEGPPGV